MLQENPYFKAVM